MSQSDLEKCSSPRVFGLESLSPSNSESTQISQENWVGTFIFGQLWRRERFESKNRNREVFDSKMAFNFDDVFDEIGGVGKYQALRYVILSCIPICMSWHLLGTIKLDLMIKSNLLFLLIYFRARYI